ncbi:MAG: hypothetical protein QXD05_00880 [Candidatus Pacearchaeota archaeon]
MDKKKEKDEVLNDEDINKKQKKILKNFLIVSGTIIIAVVVFFIFSRYNESFVYNGVNFSVVKFCDSGPFSCLITYNTKVPVIYKGKNSNYNFYLRNDPRKLGRDIPFEGDLILTEKMFVKITFNQYCQGDEKIAVENFLNLHRVIGINVSSGEKSVCDITGTNTFILIQESNTTKIEKIGPSCYNINIKNCEIIKGMERFMIETFVKINQIN